MDSIRDSGLLQQTAVLYVSCRIELHLHGKGLAYGGRSSSQIIITTKWSCWFEMLPRSKMGSDPTNKWYALHAKASQEDLAAFNLGRLQLEVLNPKLREEKMVWGRTKAVVKPLFPGYLFARFNPGKYLHLIQYARGVRQVLRCGASLLPVDEEIINSIRQRIGADGLVALQREPMVAGSSVSIHDGPLCGLRGIFVREMSDRQRVVILLDAMEARARVVIERRVLKPANQE